MGADLRSQPPTFEFGENWTSYLQRMDEDRIVAAERSLSAMLERDDLSGRSFLDVGCGSGLFSLAAFRLGADRVQSFDVDDGCVACAAGLRRRYFPEATGWTIETGSAVDRDYLERLGTFDVVYAWGVLHHTGDLRQALENMAMLPARDGLLFVSVYNDQGLRSRGWRVVKRVYNRLPRALRAPYVVAVCMPQVAFEAAVAVVNARARLFRVRPAPALHPAPAPEGRRGMSRWHDMVDWAGGYPFEVALPDVVFETYRRHGFSLQRLVTSRRGPNEFLFRRVESP